jgi:hypothetical protein
MAAATSIPSLYPVVREIDEDEYGKCCRIDGTVINIYSLQSLALALPNQSMQHCSQSDQSNTCSESDKHSLFQAKRHRSAAQPTRSEGAFTDSNDIQTASTETKNKKFEEAYVLTRQVSAACSL